jgi:hypothetical protein
MHEYINFVIPVSPTAVIHVETTITWFEVIMAVGIGFLYFSWFS